MSAMPTTTSTATGQWIFIEPHDVLMFRDAKPFTAQQSFVARSLFPPNPQTLLGALRTAALEDAGVDFSDYARGKVADEIKGRWGDPTRRTLGSLSIQGPFVAQRTSSGIERLFRVPLDVLQQKADKKEDRRYELLKPVPVPPKEKDDDTPSTEATLGFECDPPFTGWRPLAASESQGLEDATGWLTEAVYGEYLKGNVPAQVIEEEQVFVREERVGLGLNYKRRANAASKFYHAQFVRLCSDVGLLAHVRAEEFPESGVFKIGGEGRSASYETVEFAPPDRVATSGQLKLVLLTPAYFTGGWQPATGDWSPWVGDGRLVSVALGKPHYVSGWDLATQRAKPLRHYVPAGSVYFFEGATLRDKALTETPDNDLDHAAMGYGTFAVGEWKLA